MKHAILAALLVCAMPVKADTFGVHLYTAHWTNKHNNNNTGLYYKTDTGLIAGMYKNSYNRPSVYAGFVVNSGPFEIVGGLVTGYNGVCPKVCKTITPMFVPSLALPVKADAVLRLSVPNGQGVHLSLEFTL